MEIIFALLISVIILAMMYRLFHCQLQFLHHQDFEQEVYQSARLALQMMAKEIRSSIVGTQRMANFLYCYGNDRATTVAPRYKIGRQQTSVADEFFFMSTAGAVDSTVSNIIERGYWLSHKNGTEAGSDVLKRHIRKEKGEYYYKPYRTDNLRMQHMAYFVSDLNIEYWSGDGQDNDGNGIIDDDVSPADSGHWADIWDSRINGNQSPADYDDGRLPQKIRIMLEFRHPDDVWKRYHFYSCVDLWK